MLIKKHAHEQLTSFTGVTVKLRGVYKQIGGPDLHPNERKLHLFLNAGTAESLRQSIVILEHCYATGFMVAQPQKARNVAIQQQQQQQQQFQYQYQQPQHAQQLQSQFNGYPSQFAGVAPMLQLQPQHQPLAGQYQQYGPPGTQLLQPPPLLNLHQNLMGFNAKVSLGALTGPGVGHPGFNVKTRILGPGGQNVRHISTITGAKCALKGRGATLNGEAAGSEDMHLELVANSEASLRHAVELATNLVETVRHEYMAAVTQPLPATVDNHGSFHQLGPYGMQPPPQFNPPQSQSVPLGGQTPSGPLGASGHFLLGSSTAFQPPQQFGIASGLQAPIQNQSQRGCVPFVYPDGDAVVQAQQRLNVSNTMPPMRNVGERGIERNGSSSSRDQSIRDNRDERDNRDNRDSRDNRDNRDSGRDNGSMSSGRSSARQESSHASSRQDSAHSGGNGNDRRNGSSSNSDRRDNNSMDRRGGSDIRDSMDSRDSGAGSNKRRRGFQESTVYTAPTDCPLPTTATVLHVPPQKQSKQISFACDVKSGSLERDSMVDTAELTQGPLKGMEVAEPTPSVIAALAAMTERRLQAKASRPLVPAFSSFSSSDKPVVPAFSAKPPVPSFSESSFGSKSSISDAAKVTLEPPAKSFSLPGLNAYDDDDDDN